MVVKVCTFRSAQHLLHLSLTRALATIAYLHTLHTMSFKAQSLALLATTICSVLVTASPIRKPTDNPMSTNPANVLRRAIQKRDNTGVACGLWATSNWADTGKNLGEDADEVTISAGECGRIGCYDTSGVYICNDQDVEITIPMEEAIDQVDFLKDLCHESGQGEGYYYVSGKRLLEPF